MLLAVLFCLLAILLLLAGVIALLSRARAGFQAIGNPSKASPKQSARVSPAQAAWQIRQETIQKLERQFNNSPSSTDL